MSPFIPTKQTHKMSDDDNDYDDVQNPNMYIEIDTWCFIVIILTRWCHPVPFKALGIGLHH